ncbi:MAG: TIGR04283 family arsenosugar biosynthesis glycosyltransferase [Saprospiraceae bacterium]|nr:TIGR04283 family arsenosugar biosynthesis glycosyltransferase [Saprospiraceae bacterium]
MTFSIIIPTLNEADNIAKLIHFFKTNTDNRLLEIIVVDAQSKDNTAALAQTAGAKIMYASRRGRAIQMNMGASIARGEVLYFVHADCLPPPSFLDDIEQAFTEGYALGCYRYRFNSQSFMLRINSYFTRFSPLWCRGGDETLFIKKHDFEQLNGFDESYCIMEEYDFIKRSQGILPFKIIPKYALVSARKYDTNSWLRVQIANFIAFNMFRLGISTSIIAQTYRKMLNYR